MLMYSHVWLCIAMQGVRREGLVGHICSCTVMYRCAWLCIVLEGKAWLVMYAHVQSCMVVHGYAGC